MMIFSTIAQCLLIAVLDGSLTSIPSEKGLEKDVLCGAECLYVILTAQGTITEPFGDFLKRMGKPTQNGYSMNDLKIAAESCGGSTRIAKLAEIQELGLPSDCHGIVHRKPDHFQVLKKANRDLLLVFDTKLGQRQIPFTQAEVEYSDECLLIADAPEKLRTKSRTLWWIAGVALIGLSCWLLFLGIRRNQSAVLLLVLGSVIGCSGSPQTPQIMCLNPSVDAGELAVGKCHAIEFEIRNDGDAPLRISETSSSCGCTSAKLSSPIVPPKSKATLTATIVPTKNGVNHSTVNVFSNDKRQPVIQLEATWRIANPVSFSIPRINCTLSKLNEVCSFEFSIRNHTQVPFQLVSIPHEQNSPLRIELQELDGKDSVIPNTWNANVSLVTWKSGLDTGRIVALDENQVELGDMFWEVQVLPPIRVYPATVLIDRVVSPKVDFVIERSIEGDIEIVDVMGRPIPFDKHPLGDDSIQISILNDDIPEDLSISIRIGSHSVGVPMKAIP